MTDITTLQADLEKMKALYRSGLSSAGYGDKRTEMLTGDEMRAAIAALEAEINGLQGTTPKLIVCRSDKGW